MDRFNDPTASTTPPAVPASTVSGYPQEYNPVTQTAASNIRAWFWAMMQEEIRNVVLAAGLTPAATNWTQLLVAIELLGRGRIYVLTGSGTFVVPASVSALEVTAWGGGGGGGGSAVTGGNSAAGGGGGGGFSSGVFAVTPGQSIPYTVGAGGSGSPGYSAGGYPGGTTTFGSLVTCTGGSPGQGSVGGTVSAGGAPGAGSGGQINFPGSPGQYGQNIGTWFMGGAGGGAFCRSSAPGTTYVPSDGDVPGVGGGGSANTNGSGGSGGNGLIIVRC